jgi:hypothetical protein
MLDQRRGASFSLRRPPSWPSWCGAWACGRKRRPSVGPLPDRTRSFLLVDGGALLFASGLIGRPAGWVMLSAPPRACSPSAASNRGQRERSKSSGLGFYSSGAVNPAPAAQHPLPPSDKTTVAGQPRAQTLSPAINRRALPGHAVVCRASRDVPGRRDRSRLAPRDACA